MSRSLLSRAAASIVGGLPWRTGAAVATGRLPATRRRPTSRRPHLVGKQCPMARDAEGPGRRAPGGLESPRARPWEPRPQQPARRAGRTRSPAHTASTTLPVGNRPMRETIEFRLPEDEAQLNGLDRFGKCLLGSIRLITVPNGSTTAERIISLQRSYRLRSQVLIFGWSIERHYSDAELSAAPAVLLRPERVFEPAGEECTTTYDERDSCREITEPALEFPLPGRGLHRMAATTCGAGAVQTSPLRLNLNRIPRGKDFASTIAGELVCSRALRDALVDAGTDEALFAPVAHVGRRLKQRVDVYQLLVAAGTVQVDSRTLAGHDPSDRNAGGRCPRGHIIGLNRVSELWAVRETLPRSGLAATVQMVGGRAGLLRPERMIVLSQGVWAAIKGRGLRGLRVEIVRVA